MIKQFKRLSFVCLIVAISFFGLLRSQQLDIYREIARSQQQIMTVYKYLVTEYIHELDIPELTSKNRNNRSTRVVLPAPLIPTIATTSDFLTDRLISSNTILFREGYRKHTFWNSIFSLKTISSF